MFKVIKDGGFRYKARNYLKYYGYERRTLATSEDLVSSADVVIVGKYGVFYLLLNLQFHYKLYL